jgi:hypothetical protein
LENFVDPRKAATITDQTLKDAFAEGFGEGRPENSVPIVYRVSFYFQKTKIRVHDYDDLFRALTDIGEHLAHGEGTRVRVKTVAAPEIPATAKGAPPALESPEQ